MSPRDISISTTLGSDIYDAITRMYVISIQHMTDVEFKQEGLHQMQKGGSILTICICAVVVSGLWLTLNIGACT
jgi:hypothetical protein